MSAVLGHNAIPGKRASAKTPGIDTKLKAMFDRVRKEAAAVPAAQRIRNVSALIEKGRRYGA